MRRIIRDGVAGAMSHAGKALAGLLVVMLGASAPAAAAGPRIVITGGQVIEGNSGTAKAHFGVHLLFDPQLVTCPDDNPNCAARTVRVCLDYTTVAETGPGSATPGQDFLIKVDSLEGTVTLSGEGEAPVGSIDVDVLGDQVDEPNEVFKVRIALSSNCPVTASLQTAEAQATIVDDDGVAAAPPVEVAINDVTIREGDEGGRKVAFTVSLSRPAIGAVSVSYRSADGTASGAGQLGRDYGPVQGTVTFKRFQISRTIEVPVLGDLANESDETFTVELVKAIGATIVDASGTATIRDDD
jgi:Calx-beta domain-containing protein